MRSYERRPVINNNSSICSFPLRSFLPFNFTSLLSSHLSLSLSLCSSYLPACLPSSLVLALFYLASALLVAPSLSIFYPLLFMRSTGVLESGTYHLLHQYWMPWNCRFATWSLVGKKWTQEGCHNRWVSLLLWPLGCRSRHLS